ncbi:MULTISPECIES: hypothetical protein [unclassified Sinorhizobium]|uniref:hypothetical protein n=1 Tax=unclassified Sinorhizobium TaxID=2613772 RepID=UPI0035259094
MDPEVLKKAVSRAAIWWCSEKDRETFLDDIIYFKNNWSSLPGLKKYVEEELAS